MAKTILFVIIILVVGIGGYFLYLYQKNAEP